LRVLRRTDPQNSRSCSPQPHLLSHTHLECALEHNDEVWVQTTAFIEEFKYGMLSEELRNMYTEHVQHDDFIHRIWIFGNVEE
jgi:hypothetical protein